MAGVIRIFYLFTLLLLAGCSTPQKQFERTPSTAIENPELTAAGQFIKGDLEKHPGKSGFQLLASGEKAFTARNAMTQIAEKTIDVQYFSWESDSIGIILIKQLINAANRGVRIRMLIDDYHSGDRDIGFAKLNMLPNFEVRLFNPFVGRIAKNLEIVTHLSRLNHRMHNKVFIMDNIFAIIGGRNIGDQYFGVSPEVNFRDLDVITAGPIVKDISKSFDMFWNSEWAIPIEAIADEHPSSDEVKKSLKRLEHYMDKQKDFFPYPVDRTSEEIYRRMEVTKKNLVWAEAKILYDNPDKKIDTSTGYQGITPHLLTLLQETRNEFLVEAAYYIASERGIEGAGKLRDKGVRVRILTNSMATNDMAPAFVFYEKYRKDLVKNGVELYELRPDLNSQRQFWSILADKSLAGLHTKVMVFDRKTLFIGSFNLDPRSRDLNTEVGLLIFSPELAERVIAYMDIGTEPDNSYRVVLEKENAEDSGDLIWISEENGKEVRETSDPQAGFWRPISAWFISLFPIEEHI